MSTSIRRQIGRARRTLADATTSLHETLKDNQLSVTSRTFLSLPDSELLTLRTDIIMDRNKLRTAYHRLSQLHDEWTTILETTPAEKAVQTDYVAKYGDYSQDLQDAHRNLDNFDTLMIYLTAEARSRKLSVSDGSDDSDEDRMNRGFIASAPQSEPGRTHTPATSASRPSTPHVSKNSTDVKPRKTLPLERNTLPAATPVIPVPTSKTAPSTSALEKGRPAAEPQNTLNTSTLPLTMPLTFAANAPAQTHAPLVETLHGNMGSHATNVPLVPPTLTTIASSINDSSLSNMGNQYSWASINNQATPQNTGSLIAAQFQPPNQHGPSMSINSSMPQVTATSAFISSTPQSIPSAYVNQPATTITSLSNWIPLTNATQVTNSYGPALISSHQFVPSSQQFGTSHSFAPSSMQPATNAPIVNAYTTGFAPSMQQQQFQSMPYVMQQPVPLNIVDSAVLSKLDLPTFSGSLLEFPGFWDRFDSLIGQRPIDDCSKLALLKGCLQGSASICLEGLSNDHGNYQIAVRLLHDRFRNPEAVKHILCSRLLALPTCDDKGSNLERLYAQMVVLIRQMHQISGTVDHSITTMLLNKLPYFIRSSIYDRTGGTSTISPDAILQFVSDVIKKRQVLTEMETPLGRSTTNMETTLASFDQHSPPKHQNRRQNSRDNSNDTYEQQPPLPHCVFCERKHLSEECRTVKHRNDRRDVIKQKNLCYKCLRFGHGSRVCRQRTSCKSCNSFKHHTAICHRENPDYHQHDDRHSHRCSNDRFDSTKKETAVHTVDDHDAVTEEEEEDLDDDHAFVSLEPPATDITLASESREDAVWKATLMCVPVVVNNPRTNKSTSTVAFLDSGSSKTYITSTLAHRLNLDTDDSQMLTLSTFASKSSKKILTRKHEIALSLTDGSRFQMEVNSLPSLTAKMQMVMLKPPTRGQTQTLVNDCCTPEMLIGIDYFWELYDDKKPHTRHPGTDLRLIHTKLGPVVTGNMSSTSSTTAYNFSVIENGTDKEDYDARRTALTSKFRTRKKPLLHDLRNADSKRRNAERDSRKSKSKPRPYQSSPESAANVKVVPPPLRYDLPAKRLTGDRKGFATSSHHKQTPLPQPKAVPQKTSASRRRNYFSGSRTTDAPTSKNPTSAFGARTLPRPLITFSGGRVFCRYREADIIRTLHHPLSETEDDALV